MCLAPRLVSRPSSTRCDKVTALQVIDRNDNLKVFKRVRPCSSDFAYNNMLVPCGKCSQCLKKRQNSLAARCALEAQRLGSMQFVTLTYREDTVPLAIHLNPVDIDTGEFSPLSNSAVDFVERGTDLHDLCVAELSKLDKHKVRYFYFPMLDGDGVPVVIDGKLQQYVVTPSLCRRDIQLWIKSCRVQYEREFGLKLKKFSYVCCGEYGSTTFRPHAHLAFFGLSKNVVDWMASRWKRQYGYTDVKTVFAVNPDGTSGFELASRYIGKYMTKGVFECESVKNGCALKPRLMCSIGVGNMENDKVISDNLLSYYRCYDLVGEYDINTGLKKDGSSLSSEDFDSISKEILKRSTLSIHGKKFPIPNRVKYYVWFTKDSNKRFVSSWVRKEVASRLQIDFFEDFVRKLSKDYSIEFSGEMVSMVREFLDVQFTSNQVADRRGFDSLQKFYSKSKV